MFTSFTGTARPKRQVNLSGRNNNPFASADTARSSTRPLPAANALAQAQQERILRQLERERPPAATRIQKTWRGHHIRKSTRDRWRHEWDLQEELYQNRSYTPAYSSDEDCLSQLRFLGQFASPRIWDDALRIDRFINRYFATAKRRSISLQSDAWEYALSRLGKIIVAFLRSSQELSLPLELVNNLLLMLQLLANVVPELMSAYSLDFYAALAHVTGCQIAYDKRLLTHVATSLLSNAKASDVYEGFISEFLTLQDLPLVLGDLEDLYHGIEYIRLATTLNHLLQPESYGNVLRAKDRGKLLWLLSYFIDLRSHIRPASAASASPDAQYVQIVSKMISFLADEIGQRIDAVAFSLTSTGSNESERHTNPLPEFVYQQITSLVSQENVSGLLTNLDIKSGPGPQSRDSSDDASALASYALMLLRVFPRRGDEIRMWLYRGSTSALSGNGREVLPAIKYFYRAASITAIFRNIKDDPKATVSLLKPDSHRNGVMKGLPSQPAESRNQDWRIILLFLELYTFPLKVMDDEEFLSGSSLVDTRLSWTRQSALPLEDVKTLTVFLKNLAFSLYWNASEIAGIEATEIKTSLAVYFGRAGKASVETQPDEVPSKPKEMAIAGVQGLTVEYLKSMVTGVLRMLYERDSRRKFLPDGHWSMTRYFEMDRFISAVVKEEEEKHQIERSYEEGDNSRDDVDDNSIYTDHLIGTSHTQQVRHAERLRRQQQKASRRKYLESVTPRLEILQNMPFFIPFETRVQIFREFVTMDQISRRGTADADEWRFAQMNSPTGMISKHRAKVRRKNIFDDAYSQFYDLGEGLKEPIQIRFVDEFDTVEEGIDGGGVTKEFLTSITNEAFGNSNEIESLFIENDQHLLHPNPSAVEERKETLREALFKEGSPDWNENIRSLLRRYEFLGRIIGKCLYEGILVDIHFAPFFLLKWALTGGNGVAAKETSYRANLNDVRDLDEGLYQGLLQLKNYPGNVEDFSLNFAVTDDIRISPTETKRITRELRPGGASISVTNENRLVYVSYMARYRLQIQPHLQTSAFLRGLGTIVSPSWLSMFNQSELQTLVGGTISEVNIPDLRSHTQYGGVYALGSDGREHPSVELFWKVMQGFDDAEKKKVLKFVTSTPRAPLLGFGNLNPRFSIRDSGSDQTRLPSTSTCVNLLKLPIYRDERTLKEKLLYSVNSGAGFNLS